MPIAPTLVIVLESAKANQIAQKPEQKKSKKGSTELCTLI